MDDNPENSQDQNGCKVIISGKGSVQLLLSEGWRYVKNRNPVGPNHTIYYRCAIPHCPARAVTNGGPDSDKIRLKHHAKVPHNHHPDVPGNKKNELLYTFREMAHKNAYVPAKTAYEELVAEKGASEDESTKECLQQLGPFQKHRNMYVCLLLNIAVYYAVTT